MLLRPVTRSRLLTTLTINRLQLDINALANQDQLVKEPADPVTKSDAAIRGEAYRGDVVLPDRLIDAVEKAIEGEAIVLSTSLACTESSFNAPSLLPNLSFRW